MDMRFFWLLDRVAQLQFAVAHIAGVWNIADHFTKPLPKSKFYQFLPYNSKSNFTNNEMSEG